MTYLCYIHRRAGVPYFEVLPDGSRSQAVNFASHLLDQRPDGIRADIWDGERLLVSLPRGERPRAND